MYFVGGGLDLRGFESLKEIHLVNIVPRTRVLIKLYHSIAWLPQIKAYRFHLFCGDPD